MKRLALLVLVVVVFGFATSCGRSQPEIDTELDVFVDNETALMAIHDEYTATSATDNVAFSNTFMQTFDVEQTDTVDKGIPVLMERATPQIGVKATIPVFTPRTFTDGSIPDYPEPGMTTNYTVTAAGGVGPNVYLIESTSTYPASNAKLDSYVESYYVRDEAPIGSWSTEDPIVDNTDTEDRAYRIEMTLSFDDGSVREEKIVKMIYNSDPEAGFAPFDILGTLDYPTIAYPTSDPDAEYSSIVTYTQSWTTDVDIDSFWSGVVEKAVFGVRFYTEHYVDDGAHYKGTMVAYEKTLSTATTTSGSLAKQMEDVFTGSEHTALAESVIRKEVLFEVDSGVVGTTALAVNSIMRSRVIDVATLADFELQRFNLSSLRTATWPGSPGAIPNGSDPEVVADDDELPTYLVRTEMSNPDGSDVPIIVSDSTGSDFAELYATINTDASVETVTSGSANDVPDVAPASGTTIDPDGDFWAFDGTKGKVYPDAAAYDLTTDGTVEAWVYVLKHNNFAGIVHKGDQKNFKDEAYSLQFWGKKGNVAFAIVEQSPKYKYNVAKSSKRLNTGKWYYLVGTWDSSKVRLYIDGVLVKEVDNTIDGADATAGDLVIGSQLWDDGESVKGYYGFNGYINAVRVTSGARDVADILAEYNYVMANLNPETNWVP